MTPEILRRQVKLFWLDSLSIYSFPFRISIINLDKDSNWIRVNLPIKNNIKYLLEYNYSKEYTYYFVIDSTPTVYLEPLWNLSIDSQILILVLRLNSAYKAYLTSPINNFIYLMLVYYAHCEEIIFQPGLMFGLQRFFFSMLYKIEFYPQQLGDLILGDFNKVKEIFYNHVRITEEIGYFLDLLIKKKARRICIAYNIYVLKKHYNTVVHPQDMPQYRDKADQMFSTFFIENLEKYLSEAEIKKYLPNYKNKN